jgi:UPF0716 protein FxsA
MPLIFLILLALPLVELVLTGVLLASFGWNFALWLLASFGLGLWLTMRARTGLGLLAHARRESPQAILKTFIMSARAFGAGLLFMFPGVLTDIVALVLLILPGRALPATAQKAANDGVIDVEFREVREAQPKLPDRPL